MGVVGGDEAVGVASAVHVARALAWWASRPQRPWQGCERQVVDGEVNQWRARPRPPRAGQKCSARL